MPASLAASAWTELDTAIAGEVQTGLADRRLHAQDASVYAEMPTGVVRPRTQADVVTAVRWAAKHGMPITPRAAATSLAGQTTGGGMIMDLSRHLHATGTVDAAKRRVTVDPGVILDDLNDDLAPTGLFFPPDTSTSNRCMIGGMVANNSCGAFSVSYGTTREHTISVDCVLADGSAVTFGPLSDAEVKTKIAQDDREGQIYRTLDQILREHATTIRSGFPKPEIHRRNTGYALDKILEQSPWTPGGPACNLAALVCGSEGTLGMVTSSVLNLVERPRHRALVAVHFESVIDACKASVLAVEHRCHAAELVDGTILEATKHNRDMLRRRWFVEGDPGALLAIELEDGDEQVLEQRLEALVAALKEHQLGHAHPVLRGAQMDDVWALRKAGLGLLMGIVGEAKAVAVIEDAAVAAADLPAYVSDIGLIMERHGVSCVHYGHAAAGELHLRPNLDLRQTTDAKHFASIAQEVAELVARYGGSLSGEHGDGRLRAPFISTVMGDEVLALFKQVKQAFDPEGIFNPGKIVDAKPVDADWRTGPGTPDPQIDTAFDWSNTLGLVRATEQCNGAGVCRKSAGRGTMCPSYQATREERHTTRGRANLFRILLTSADPKQTFADDDLADALKLCLSCKACASECPANVDMARLKAEFKHQRHQAQGIPGVDKRFGRFAAGAKLARLTPRLASLVANTSLAKRVLGVDPRRSMPSFARRSFSALHKRHQTLSDGSRGAVALYVDEFTEFLEPEIAIDALTVLERCGYRVIPITGCDSGRAMISRGLLTEASAALGASLEAMRPQIEAGVPIVGVEPSTILGFIDEAPDLVAPGLRPLAKQAAGLVSLIDDFLAAALSAGLVPPWRSRPLRAIVHGHCHQKSLVGTEGTMAMLRAIPDSEIIELGTGCCGMAGSFGYENYDVSMAVGEQTLFPAVRERQTETVVVAPGTSCRHQIKDGTGTKAVHPITLMANMLR
ncbi:MAG: FAD-binding protein [Planctomycetota bacterium]|jgi:FAD/FMN-containing dehydrogenase/Fe-S oxidoreductase|nr:FAD-binding protein [Planctomycetota bacterium]